jgi:hypothetical protein
MVNVQHRPASGFLDFKTDSLMMAKSGHACIFCTGFVLYSLEQTKCCLSVCLLEKWEGTFAMLLAVIKLSLVDRSKTLTVSSMRHHTKVLFYPVLPDIVNATDLFHGSQASPACPFGNSNMPMKINMEQ